MLKIGIIGSGAMGAGIAQVAAAAGHTVFLYDNNEVALTKALKNLEKTLQKLAEKGKMTEQQVKDLLSNVLPVHEVKGLSACGLIIEAIVENLDIKKSVFQSVEAIVSETAILATNTSSLPVTAIAAGLSRPERFLGIHFFNPAPLMRLVEIIPALQTGSEVLEVAEQLIQSWGKTAVRAVDTPAFIVNRVARPFYGESLRILEEGIADMPTIDWAMTEMAGFRMGPFALMDFIGHDVNYVVTETVFKAFFYDPRYKPSFSQKRLIEAGWLGKKTGRGFYDYREGASLPTPTKDPELGQRIVDRVVAMLINEAADALFWGIATEKDIDLAMTLGVNYPKGLLAWCRELGPKEVVTRMDALYAHYHEDRYRCSPLLRVWAAKA